MTKWAGKLTPKASVEVATNTCILWCLYKSSMRALSSAGTPPWWYATPFLIRWASFGSCISLMDANGNSFKLLWFALYWLCPILSINWLAKDSVPFLLEQNISTCFPIIIKETICTMWSIFREILPPEYWLMMAGTWLSRPLSNRNKFLEEP